MSRILSSLLSTRENGVLFSLLNQNCNALACGIVQLVIAAPPKRKEWKSHSVGVLCLVLDKTIHSTFMRLYCLKRAILLWEQELYTPFEYSETCPYFHTFPGDDCQTGLNFADEKEAKQFYTAVQKQISDNKARLVLTRRYSVGSFSELKDKLDNYFGGPEIHKRSSSRNPHNADSVATPTGSPTVSSQPQTLPSADEESVSLAQRKGPLPPIPPHARKSKIKLHHSGSFQNSDCTTPIPPWVPPPPSFSAPRTPPSSAAIKKSASFTPGNDYSSAVMRRLQSSYFNADMKTDYDDHL